MLAAREDGAANATIGGIAAYGGPSAEGRRGVLASATYKAVTKIVPLSRTEGREE
ncbi:hypothetical protein MASR2M17_13160 [Aminivibrio sp.]